MYYKNVCIIHSAPPPSYLHIAPHHIWTMHCTNGIPPNEKFQKRSIIANIVVMRMIFTSYQGLSIDYIVTFEGLGRSVPPLCSSTECKSFLLKLHMHCTLCNDEQQTAFHELDFVNFSNIFVTPICSFIRGHPNREAPR